VDKERLKDMVGLGRRFPFGLPRTDNATATRASAKTTPAKLVRRSVGEIELHYLWIQLFHSAFNEKGRAGFVMANSASDARSSEQELRVVKLTDYTAEKVRTLCASPDELRVRWAAAGQRADIIQQLADRGIDFPTVAAQAGKPEADPFDLLCHLAFNAPVLTGRQHADRLKQQHVAFSTFFAPEARETLNDLLENYVSDGELHFTLPDVLKAQPISDHGNVNEIIGIFGGADQLRNAVTRRPADWYRLRFDDAELFDITPDPDPPLRLSGSGRNAFSPCPLAGGAIGHGLFLQHLRRVGRQTVGRFEHGPDFAADERSHLRPGDAMHPHRIDAGGNRHWVRVGDELSP
jgi:hypothetical protein